MIHESGCLMSQRDRIDLESRGPLEAFLASYPSAFDETTDVAERRAIDDAFTREMAAEMPANDHVTRNDRRIRGSGDDEVDIVVRIYRPKGGEETLAGLYFIHGGGMMFGSLDSEDHTAAMLAQTIPAVVVSVGYRLAPENPHPTPVLDCLAGLEWMAGHASELGLDRERIATYGGSAGGGLAMGTSLLVRDRGGPPIAYQMVSYPMLDDRCDSPSSHEFTEVGVVDRPMHLEAWAHYLKGREADQYAAPSRASNMSHLPPTFIDVGEVDVFRDEGIAFAARLLAAEVPTELHVYPGAYHASEMIAPEAELSQRIWATRIAALRRALGVTPAQ